MKQRDTHMNVVSSFVYRHRYVVQDPNILLVISPRYISSTQPGTHSNSVPTFCQLCANQLDPPLFKIREVKKTTGHKLIHHSHEAVEDQSHEWIQWINLFVMYQSKTDESIYLLIPANLY